MSATKHSSPPPSPGTVLISEDALQHRVAELAVEVSAALPDREPILVGLLTGSFVFVADLGRELSRLGVHPQIEFIETTHYGAGRRPTGRVELRRPLQRDVRGRAVLLVDDILDSGRSLTKAMEHASEREPAWLRSCVLLDKTARREVPIRADHVGFQIPDSWVIGYGLDDDGRYRELPHVARLR